MAGGGYIKLYRAVRGTAIADNPVYFAAWVHLLLMATHTDHDQVVGRQIVHLKPGQLVFGRDKFSASTGISVNQLRAALTIMKTLGMVTIKPNAKYSLISITNWSEYQHQPPADSQQFTSSSPADSHKQEGSKNVKNGKNENIYPAPLTPDAVFYVPTNKYGTQGETYPIDQPTIDQWAMIYPAADIDGEIRKIIGWSDSNPTKRKTHGGMKRFINSWLSRAQDKGHTNPMADPLTQTNDRW